MTETPDNNDQPPMAYGQQPPPPYGQQPPPPYGPPPGGGWGSSGDPSAPFGRDPVTGLAYSDKSKTAAGLLQLLLPCVSVCGVGRLMTGHIAIGLVQLLSMFVGWVLTVVLIGFPIVFAVWLWSVIDGIMILSGSVKDANGLPLRP